MRVIAGQSRGRILRAPPGRSVRPTSDRVREAIFDILGSQTELGGLAVADLFAGSGAMGIEALSRGARSAVFVDRDPAALRAVRANLAATGLGGASTSVVRADVLRWLSCPRPRPVAGPPSGGFDLAFVDPPYAFAQWGKLLGLLDTRLGVLESDRVPEVPRRFEVTRSRRYGGTLVTVVRATGK